MKLGEVANLIRDAYVRDAPTAEVVRWIDRLRTRGWPPMVAPFSYKDLLALMRHGGPGQLRWVPRWQVCRERYQSECGKQARSALTRRP